MKVTRVRTFYPADPAGIVPGGVDTFIRGLIKWAPADIEFSLVGMTTDDVARPVGQWTTCDLGRRQFEFFPVVKVQDAGARGKMPLSLRYTFGAAKFHKFCSQHFDAYEFHRIEPALLYLNDPRPKNAFFHQDMAVIRTSNMADILWRRMPRVYFALERLVAKSLRSAWCVREEGAESLRKRYPVLAPQINFVPTWVDPEVFFPCAPATREALRKHFEQENGLDPQAFRIITVGRLDTQKDPNLLLTAFEQMVSKGQNVELLFVGDGVLRTDLEVRVASSGLGKRVRFLGLKSAREVADILKAADCFGLSSAYEGMPMAMLEALGSGLPVVTTPVGEVKRVIVDGINGFVTPDRSVASLVACFEAVINNRAAYSEHNCVDSIKLFVPNTVLAPVYDNYRRSSESRVL